MLTVPTNPLFLETMLRFVKTFVPTLTIHKVHIGAAHTRFNRTAN